MIIREIGYVSKGETTVAPLSGAVFQRRNAWQELSHILSFRTAPRTPWYVEVPQESFDPYGWFLTQDMERKARENGASITPDRGHPFLLERHRFTGFTDAAWRRNSSTSTHGYRVQNAVPVAMAPQNGVFGSGILQSPSWSDDLAAFGQLALSRTAPKPYVWDAATFLAELKDGLPKLAGIGLLKGRAKDLLRNSGSEYLNYQFGIKPLLADVKTALQALLDVDSTLRAVRNQQGKPKHRRYGLGAQSYNDTRPVAYVNWWNGEEQFSPYGGQALQANTLLTNSLKSSGFLPRAYGSGVALCETSTPWTTVRTCTTERWFEGSFTSYFDYPIITDSYVEKAKSLINTDFTLLSLWEIAPWSWMVDWVFHIQDTIASASIASDSSVVLNYGYVMEKTDFRTASWGFLSDKPYVNYFLSNGQKYVSLVESSYRRRIRANPFGFQVSSFSAFSADQLAILAALGFSRR